MSDTAQMGLQEPEQLNWNEYHEGGGKFVPPPPAVGPDGKYIVYYGQVPTSFNYKDFLGVTNEGFRSFLIDPIKIVKSGNGADGYQLRFTRVSTKKFTNKAGEKIDASTVGNFLRAAQSLSKPQKNAEYEAAVKMTAGKVVPLTIEWEARNKETGETIKGFKNFPLDPDRPGQRKCILKAGDKYTDENGQEQVVKSEVLFANARLRYFERSK